MGVESSKGSRGSVSDPFANRFGVLRLSNGDEVPSEVSSDCLVEDVYVSKDQLVFAGMSLYRVVRCG